MHLDPTAVLWKLGVREILSPGFRNPGVPNLNLQYENLLRNSYVKLLPVEGFVRGDHGRLAARVVLRPSGPSKDLYTPEPTEERFRAHGNKHSRLIEKLCSDEREEIFEGSKDWGTRLRQGWARLTNEESLSLNCHQRGQDIIHKPISP